MFKQAPVTFGKMYNRLYYISQNFGILAPFTFVNNTLSSCWNSTGEEPQTLNPHRSLPTFGKCQVSLFQLPWRGHHSHAHGLVVTPPRLSPCPLKVTVFTPFLSFPSRKWRESLPWVSAMSQAVGRAGNGPRFPNAGCSVLPATLHFA